MSDTLLQALLSNLLISALLAMMAWIVQRSGRWPAIANGLWLLVLIKLITPPLLTIELIPVARLAGNTSAMDADHERGAGPFEIDPGGWPTVGDLQLSENATEVNDSNELLAGHEVPHSESREPRNATCWHPPKVLGWICCGGGVISVLLIGRSLFRIGTFNRLLNRHVRPADGSLQRTADQLARQFGLQRAPWIGISAAEISPFLWWSGGRPRIILPTAAIERLPRSDLDLVLAHELAHLRRKDHWVRWLELVVGHLFWWNPLVAWSRRQLRVTEELACDALVIEQTQTDRHVYAAGLLNMAELLSQTAIRPPSVASPMTSGGMLEKRLKMIMKNRKSNTAVGGRTWLVVLAVAVFPLGLVYGQDYEAVKRRLGQAVEAKELSKPQAEFMLEALELSMRLRDMDGEREFQREREMVEREEMAKREELERRRNRGLEEAMIKRREMVERRDRLQQAAAELKLAMKMGKIDEDQAKQKFAAIERELAGEGDRQREEWAHWENDERELAERKEQFRQITERIENAVREGMLSKHDAEAKLTAARRELFGDQERESRGQIADQPERQHRKLAEMMEKMELAVQEGKLSHAAAVEKAMALQKEMAGLRERMREMENQKAERERRERRENDERGERESDMGGRQAMFEQFERGIDASVEQGRITREQAEKKLMFLRRRFFGNRDELEEREEREVEREEREVEREERQGSEGKLEILKRKFQAEVAEIKQAVRAGKLDEADAQAKVEAIRREMFGDQEERERDEE